MSSDPRNHENAHALYNSYARAAIEQLTIAQQSDRNKLVTDGVVCAAFFASVPAAVAILGTRGQSPRAACVLALSSIGIWTTNIFQYTFVGTKEDIKHQKTTFLRAARYLEQKDANGSDLSRDSELDALVQDRGVTDKEPVDWRSIDWARTAQTQEIVYKTDNANK